MDKLFNVMYIVGIIVLMAAGSMDNAEIPQILLTALIGAVILGGGILGKLAIKKVPEGGEPSDTDA